MGKEYMRIPADEVLKSRTGWTRIGNEYLSIQADVVAIQRRGRSVAGPALAKKKMPGGSKVKIEDKTATITKRMDQIQKAIHETVASKFSTELATKIASEASVGAVLSAKLSNEIRSKAGVELTDAVQSSVAQTRCFEIQNTREISRSVEYEPTRDGRRRKPWILHFYVELWPWKWDFYLYRVRYLRLHYRRNWLWKQVRNTIATASVEHRSPLFRMRYYEPQDEYSFVEGEHEPDVLDTDANDVRIECFSGQMPNVRFPSGQSLEELAFAAFPVSGEEKTPIKSLEFVSLAGNFSLTRESKHKPRKLH